MIGIPSRVRFEFHNRDFMTRVHQSIRDTHVKAELKVELVDIEFSLCLIYTWELETSQHISRIFSGDDIWTIKNNSTSIVWLRMAKYWK